jgi:hypothetical protein
LEYGIEKKKVLAYKKTTESKGVFCCRGLQRLWYCYSSA